MSILTQGIVIAYIILFIWQGERYRARCWLWISGLAWLIIGLISSYILPYICGIWHKFNLYLFHFYILLGSLFYIGANRLKQTGPYLYYLARSSWLQYQALGLWILLILASFNQPWQLPITISVLQMSLLQPLFWLGSQWILMILLYTQEHDQALPMSWRRRSLFSCVFLWQALFIFLNIYNLI